MTLTLLQHRDKIWKVYLTRLRETETSVQMQLEFERTSEDGKRLFYTRQLSGPLLSALQGGESLPREALATELARALGEEVAPGPADS